MSGGDPHDQDARATAEAVARRSYGRLVAYLAARTRDVASAEDALSEAFAAALADWPISGTPEAPEAWLMTVARRRLVDHGRRRAIGDGVAAHLQIIAEIMTHSEVDEPTVPDQRLALMFACAHPAIDQNLRAPLILQTVLGFDAAAIASAFLVSPAAMSQRLVRAKAKIKLAGISFHVPEREELPARLDAVLQAVYAAYAEGWSDPSGTETRRRNLADEAIWLGGLLAQLLPDEPEALGLQSLMLHAEARKSARRNAAGGYIPLSAQDPALWRADLIAEAEALLVRASRMQRIGRYQLEAAIQSVHADRRRSGLTDWPAIVQFYDVLARITGSPVVAINRAVAIGEARGAKHGLDALDQIAGDQSIATYQPYWAARAGLLARTGAVEAADQAYAQAIGLEPDPALRRFLQGRRAELAEAI